MRLDNCDAIVAQIDVGGSEYVAYAGCEHRCVVDEEGTIGSYGRRYGGKTLLGQLELQQLVEAEQGERRIGTTAAKSGSVGNHLVQIDVDRRERDNAVERPVGFHHKVLFGLTFYFSACHGQSDGVAVSGHDFEYVTPLYRIKASRQVVIAVVAATRYVQTQIDLGIGKQYHVAVYYSCR